MIYRFQSKDIVLPNGHPGHQFLMFPDWVWDYEELRWVKLKKITQSV